MDILRNSIKITGITPAKMLPSKINGQVIEYSDTEHIYLPDDKPRISSIHQISIKLETSVGRTIDSPSSKVIVIDGIKNIRIIYSYRSRQDKPVVVEMALPYNTFIDLPMDSGEIKDINVYVLDAYFSQIGSRRLYAHMIYMVHAEYNDEKNKKKDIFTTKLEFE